MYWPEKWLSILFKQKESFPERAFSWNRLQLNDPREFNEDIINKGVSRIKRDKKDQWGTHELVTERSYYHQGPWRDKEEKWNLGSLISTGARGGATARKYIPKQARDSLSSHSPSLLLVEFSQKAGCRASLVVQWLRLLCSHCREPGLIPSGKFHTPHRVAKKQGEKRKEVTEEPT